MNIGTQRLMVMARVADGCGSWNIRKTRVPGVRAPVLSVAGLNRAGGRTKIYYITGRQSEREKASKRR